jgi:hypothetical protein
MPEARQLYRRSVGTRSFARGEEGGPHCREAYARGPRGRGQHHRSTPGIRLAVRASTADLRDIP